MNLYNKIPTINSHLPNIAAIPITQDNSRSFVSKSYGVSLGLAFEIRLLRLLKELSSYPKMKDPIHTDME
jgi:hypothetical protein